MRDPEEGCPFPQHMYDAVAAALAQGMSVERMQVGLPELAGMSSRAVLQLAKKVEAGGRVPGRHGVHRNHRRKMAENSRASREFPPAAHA